MGKPAFDPNQAFQPIKPAFDPNQAFENPNAQPSKLEQIAGAIRAGATKFSNGALFNYAPQLAGAAGAATGAVYDAAHGRWPENMETDYRESRDGAIADLKESSEKYPVTSGVGEMVGMVLSPASKALAPFKAAKSAGVGLKVGAAAANGALLGAAMNPGDKAGELDPLQIGERWSNTAWGAGGGAAVDGALRGAGPLAKQGISTLLGPSKEAISKYLGNSVRINKAPSIATMKDTIDEQIRTLKTRVQLGDMSVNQAQTALKDLDQQISHLTRDAGREYAESLPQLRESLQSAHAELAVQKAGVEQGLNAVPHPRSIADDVHAAVGVLKGQVLGEAAKAREILAKSGATIETAPIREHLDQEIAKMMVDGQMPVTQSGKAAVERLIALKKNLAMYPEQLSGDSARKVMKQLDDEVTYLHEAGGFGDSYSQAIKGARKVMDAGLKTDPEYAAQMKTVAEKAELLEHANDLFGTREKAYSAMGGIHAPGKVPQREVLARLGQHTGQEFAPAVEKFSEAQNTLKNGLDPIFEKLPAQEKVRAGEQINEIAPHLKQTHVDTVVNESGLPSKRAAQEAELERLNRDLHLAKESAAPFSKWSKDSTQNKLQSLVSRSEDRASIEAQRELEMLDRMRPEGEPSYLESIDDNRVRAQFSRDNTRGSRNAVMWKSIGGAAGAAVGAVAPGSHIYTVPGGAGAGALIGGYVDKHGGEIAKGMLDHYLNNQGTYNAIRNMNPNRVVSPWLMLGQEEKK